MRRFATAAARRVRVESGFTLVEVMVAVVVLAIGLGAMFGLLDTASHVNLTNRIRQAGTNLARELVEDSRSLPYTQLNTTALPGALQPEVSNSTVSGSNLLVTRAVSSLSSSASSMVTFSVSFTACSLDDPADGYGNHSSPPNSGGGWCPDVAANGSTDSNPDDYKRVSVTVTPTGARTTPVVQQTVLIYSRTTHGPAVSCLSTNSTCPGTNQTITNPNITSQLFNVTTTSVASSIQWLVNGNPPPSGQVPSGAFDPYTPSGTSSQFTWDFPTTSGVPFPDGTYAISAQAFDSNGNSGTKSTLQITLNRHMVIPPTTVNAGWNNQINGVDIQWVPSIDQDVLYYRVYHQVGSNSSMLVSGCTQVNGVSCDDLSAPSPGTEPATCNNPPQSFTTSNQYWVVGVDTDPSTGQPRESTQLSAKIDANLCDHPPNTPTSLNGSLSGGQLTLNWLVPSPQDPDSGDTIQAWRIYRWPTGTSVNFPGSRYELVGAQGSSGNTVTSFADPNPDPGGITQNYCVTAVDSHLNESTCSNTVSG